MSFLDKLPEQLKSRKLLVFFFTCILIMLAGFFMAADKIVAVITGLLGAVGLYSGSNVGSAWVDAVHGSGSANVIAAKSSVATTTTETVNPPKVVTTTTQKAADKPPITEEEGS